MTAPRQEWPGAWSAASATTVVSGAAGSNCLLGSAIGAYVLWDGGAGSPAPSSVTDSANQTYLYGGVTVSDNNTGLNLAIYYLNGNASATALVLTATWAAATVYRGIWPLEIPGVTFQSPPNGQAQDGQAGTNGAITSGASGTLSAAPAMVHALTVDAAGNALSTVYGSLVAGASGLLLSGNSAASGVSGSATLASTAPFASTFSNSTDTGASFLTLQSFWTIAAAGSGSGAAIPQSGPGISPDVRANFTARQLSSFITQGNLRGRASGQGVGYGPMTGAAIVPVVGWVPQAGPGHSPDYNKTFTRPSLSTTLPTFTAMRGVAVWAGQSAGNIGAVGALTGAALWQGASQGFVTATAVLSGVANSEGQAYGFLSSGVVASITGVAAWSGYPFASLGGVAAVHGVGRGEGSGYGSLGGAGSLVGSAIWQGFGYASIMGSGALAGAVTWQAHPQGFLTGQAQLSGRANGQGFTVAPLTGTAALSGAAAWSAYPTASMTGSGALKGVSLGQGSGSATLLATGALKGVTVAQSQAVGLLLYVGAGQMQGVGQLASFAFGSATTSSYQFGWAICTAQGQNGLPVARACYIEESAAIIEIQCFTPTGLPFVPNAISYRIDDVVSGAQILDWTQMNAALFMEIVATSAQNAMISHTRCSEAHQVLFRITDGFGNTNYARVEFDLIRVAGLN